MQTTACCKKGKPPDVIKIRHQNNFKYYCFTSCSPAWQASSRVVRLPVKREALVQGWQNVLRKKFIMLETRGVIINYIQRTLLS